MNRELIPTVIINEKYLFINSQFYSDMIELFHSVFHLPEIPDIELIRKILDKAPVEKNQLFAKGLVNLDKKYAGKKYENLINIAMDYAPIPYPIQKKYANFEKVHFLECKKCHRIYLMTRGGRSGYCFTCKPHPKSKFHTKCMICHKPLINKRRGAKTCSPACKVALYRKNKKKSISSK